MQKETCERIVKAFEEMLSMMGFADFREGVAHTCAALEKQVRLLRQMRSRKALEATLFKYPEPKAEELEELLGFLRTFPYQLRRTFPKALKELPHDPGGHPPSFTASECREICSRIGALLAQGVRLKDAQSRLAQQKGVSLRTIQRVWQKRARLLIS